MTGKEAGLSLEELKELLETEFMVKEQEWNRKMLEHAWRALQVFDSVEDFLNHTGWGNDNPEIQSEEYLTNHRICRWFRGRFFYFSWLLWEEGRG